MTETIACLSAACLEKRGELITLPQGTRVGGRRGCQRPCRPGDGGVARSRRGGPGAGPVVPAARRPARPDLPHVAGIAAALLALLGSAFSLGAAVLAAPLRPSRADRRRAVDADQRRRAVRLLRESATRDAGDRRRAASLASRVVGEPRAGSNCRRRRMVAAGAGASGCDDARRSRRACRRRTGLAVRRPRSHSATRGVRAASSSRPEAQARAGGVAIAALVGIPRGSFRQPAETGRCFLRRRAASSSSTSRPASRPTRTRGSPRRSTGWCARTASYGLILFSDTAYQALPPNTPARELRAAAAVLRRPAGDSARRAAAGAAQPWTEAFWAGTRISTGLSLALDVIREERLVASGRAPRQRPRRRQRRHRPGQPGRDRLPARGIRSTSSGSTPRPRTPRSSAAS